MKLFCTLLASVALTLSFSSCSPSSVLMLSDQKTEMAEKILRDQIDSQSKGQIKLVKFTKTEGQSLAGDTVYKLLYEAELEFKADGTWLSRDFLNHHGLTYTFNPGPRSTTAMGEFANNSNGGTAMKTGDHATIAGKIMAQKGANGWVFDYDGEGQIKTPQSAAAN
jgi:hypothetical protein